MGLFLQLETYACLLFILFLVTHRKETTFSSLSIWHPAWLCLGVNPRAQSKAFVLGLHPLGFRKRKRTRNLRVHTDLGLNRFFLLKQFRLFGENGRKRIKELPNNSNKNDHIAYHHCQCLRKCAECFRDIPVYFSKKYHHLSIIDSI